jgi:hypothetical protein
VGWLLVGLVWRWLLGCGGLVGPTGKPGEPFPFTIFLFHFLFSFSVLNLLFEFKFEFSCSKLFEYQDNLILLFTA